MTGLRSTTIVAETMRGENKRVGIKETCEEENILL